MGEHFDSINTLIDKPEKLSDRQFKHPEPINSGPDPLTDLQLFKKLAVASRDDSHKAKEAPDKCTDQSIKPRQDKTRVKSISGGRRKIQIILNYS